MDPLLERTGKKSRNDIRSVVGVAIRKEGGERERAKDGREEKRVSVGGRDVQRERGDGKGF